MRIRTGDDRQGPRHGRRAALALSTAALLLGGCSTSGGGLFAEEDTTLDFAVDGAVTTYNGLTIDGATGSNAAAFSRVLPGFSYRDGEGLLHPDRDLGTVERRRPGANGEPGGVLYTLNPEAVWSDGEAVDCRDVALALIAGTPEGKAAGFRAVASPGLSLVDGLDCAPESKTVVVHTTGDPIPADWAGLVPPGSIMPWHVLAHTTGTDDLMAAYHAAQNGNPGQLQDIAAAWNSAFTLPEGDVDAAAFPSLGPYRLAKREGTLLELVANDKWWGAPPREAEVRVRTEWSAAQEAPENITIDAYDIPEADTEPIQAADDVSTVVNSQNIMQLRMGSAGTLAPPAARRAFAACVPAEAIAADIASPRIARGAQQSTTATSTPAPTPGSGNPEAAQNPGADPNVTPDATEPTAPTGPPAPEDAAPSDAATPVPPMTVTPAQSMLPLSGAPVVRDVVGAATEAARGARQAADDQARAAYGSSDLGSVEVTLGVASDSDRAAAERIVQVCGEAGFTVTVKDGLSRPSDLQTAEGTPGPAVDALIVGTAGATGPGGGADPLTGLAGLTTVGPDFSGTVPEGWQDDITRILMAGSLRELGDAVSAFGGTVQDSGWVVPLYAQPRRIVRTAAVRGVTASVGGESMGWNLDRWILS